MMIQSVKLVSLFVGYGLVGFGGDVDSCRFEVDRELSIAASASDRLELSAGSGELRVAGRDGLDEVRVTARICASDEAYLEDLRVTLDRAGDDIVLRAHYPDRLGRRSWRGNDVARIDLFVEVPLNMSVDIEDSSGSMEVQGTGALRIADSSGSIGVRGINGPVTIDDSSGSLDVQDVSGDVEIEDGSGEIDVRGIQGTVRLRDGSGSIEVEEVDQDVIVERDGSGSITVRDVRGDFTVRRDGSGSIRHSGVEGIVEIPEDKRERRRRRGG